MTATPNSPRPADRSSGSLKFVWTRSSPHDPVNHPPSPDARAFAPFGDVLDTAGAPDKMINQGLCGRYHDRATLDFSDGQAGISIFDAEARSLPMVLDMVERHPDGSQAFIPISRAPYLVVVAPDAGRPAGNARGLHRRPRTGRELPSQHLAWGLRTPDRTGTVCGDRQDRHGAEPTGTLVQGGNQNRDAIKPDRRRKRSGTIGRNNNG